MAVNLGYPDRKINTNFYHWYIIMKQFSHSTISKWITDELYLDSEDSLINDFVKSYSIKKEIHPESNENIGSESRCFRL
jgi:hypothetical protein